MFPYNLEKTTHMNIIEKNTTVIKIDKSIRNQLLAYLDTLGYNTYRLMPDLSSVCLAITRKLKERKPPKDKSKQFILWFDDDRSINLTKKEK